MQGFFMQMQIISLYIFRTLNIPVEIKLYMQPDEHFNNNKWHVTLKSRSAFCICERHRIVHTMQYIVLHTDTRTHAPRHTHTIFSSSLLPSKCRCAFSYIKLTTTKIRSEKTNGFSSTDKNKKRGRWTFTPNFAKFPCAYQPPFVETHSII